MNNPTLLSESFERAAYAHARSMENFSCGNFEIAVEGFRRSVDKLQQIMAMQAENDQQKAVGGSMAYTENDFMAIQ